MSPDRPAPAAVPFSTPMERRNGSKLLTVLGQGGAPEPLADPRVSNATRWSQAVVAAYEALPAEEARVVAELAGLLQVRFYRGRLGWIGSLELLAACGLWLSGEKLERELAKS